MSIFYIVIGRIPYDDEDTVKIVEASDAGEADKKFRELILADNDGESTETDDDGEPCVYINAIIKVTSKTAPVIEYQQY